MFRVNSWSTQNNHLAVNSGLLVSWREKARLSNRQTCCGGHVFDLF